MTIKNIFLASAWLLFAASCQGHEERHPDAVNHKSIASSAVFVPATPEKPAERTIFGKGQAPKSYNSYTRSKLVKYNTIDTALHYTMYFTSLSDLSPTMNCIAKEKLIKKTKSLGFQLVFCEGWRSEYYKERKIAAAIHCRKSIIYLYDAIVLLQSNAITRKSTESTIDADRYDTARFFVSKIYSTNHPKDISDKAALIYKIPISDPEIETIPYNYMQGVRIIIRKKGSPRSYLYEINNDGCPNTAQIYERMNGKSAFIFTQADSLSNLSDYADRIRITLGP